MLLKLVNDRETTILSGIDSVSMFYEQEKNVKTKILSVVFKDEKPKLNFALSQETETEFAPVWEAFLMNDRGETIERLY